MAYLPILPFRYTWLGIFMRSCQTQGLNVGSYIMLTLLSLALDLFLDIMITQYLYRTIKYCFKKFFTEILII